jgi:hypothetical protein
MYQRALELESIFMWGLAKNAGKTMALRHLLHAFAQAGQRVGVTSIGMDGEEFDSIDARIAKPRITLEPGMLFATSIEILRRSSFAGEVLETLEDQTPLGRIVIARTNSRCTIEIVGPSTASRTARVVSLMRQRGCSHVLIDGALDRRAAASPRIAAGIVLSTGAVLSKDLDEISAQTAYAVERIGLPAHTDDLQPQRGTTIVLDEHQAAHHVHGMLATSPSLADMRDRGVTPTTISMPGALTDACISAVHRYFPRAQPTVVVEDFTRIFLSRRAWQQSRARGLVFAVRKPARLVAITINPVAPYSHRFESAQMLDRLSRDIPTIPVVDVLAGKAA